MGLREKVTITIVIIALTQIACRHCMPRTPSKASLKRYLNDLKPVKSNPVSTPYSRSKVNKPKQTFGKTDQNGRISQDSVPKKSLFDTYNFPENEYPLDNAPRDPFRNRMNLNDNKLVNTLLKARNLQSSAVNDLKKEMKIKRKILSNKQVNNENIPINTDTSSIKIASNSDSVRLLDPETFPEVQYPLNTMETWGQNYWNYLPYTQEKQLNGLGSQALNHKVRDGNKPVTRLTKATASKFLQSYDKLKEEQRRTSTENSKRSNVGQKGLSFTKTATCERVSDDFITAGLFSNTLGKPSDTKTLDSNTTDSENSTENTCPLIENPYHAMPLPYKFIEENIENFCPAIQKNNTQESEDMDSDVIAKTLQLIEEILINEDNSSKDPPKNKSKEKENNVNTVETDYSNDSANKDISTNPIDNTDNSTVVPIKEFPQEVCDDVPVDILPNNRTSLPEKTIPENTAAGALNVRMPFTELVTYGALKNASNSDLTDTTTLSNAKAVPGYTSVIIIPMSNDGVGKAQSHMVETTSDTPIIVYLPSTELTILPSQTALNHIVSSSLDNPVPNNQLHNVLSNMAPVQSDNPSSTALVSDLLNSISDSGSSLPMHETLPTNSKCYNNENSPSSTRENPISDVLIHDASFVTTSCDEKLSQQPVETENFDMVPDTLPPTLDFERPVFADSDVMSLSYVPYNNVLNNELRKISRKIDSDEQITKTSKDSYNKTTEHLHKTTSMDSVSNVSLSENPKGVLCRSDEKALDNDFSSETPIDSLEIHHPDSPPKLPVSTDKSISLSPIFKQVSEPIDEMKPTLLIDAPTVELPPLTETSLTPTPAKMVSEIPSTIISDTTSDAPQPIGHTPTSSPILHSTLMTTDLTVKTELYKIRQILDRMLTSEIPTNDQPSSTDTILSSISETDSQPPPLDKVLSPIQTSADSQPPPLDKVLSPIQTSADSQPPPLDKVLSPIQTSADSQPPPLDKVLSPIQTPDDSQPPPLDKVLSPIQTPADSQPPPLDKVLSPIQTPDDSQPPPLDKVLSPIQTPADSQPPPLDKVLSPIQTSADSQPPPLDKVWSPIQTPDDSQPPPLDKVLSPIQTSADSQPPPLDKVLSPIQTPDDSQPPPLDKVLSPIQTPADSQPPPLDKVLSPIQTSADSQPPPLDKVWSPIQTPDDSQPPPLDKVLSPIQTSADSQPPPLDKVWSPIQTPADSQPPPLDKVLSPIQTPADSQPPPLDKVLSPIQTPADSQPPPLDRVLPSIQTPADSQPPPLDKVWSPIQTPADSQPPPLDKVLSPIQTPADSQPPPLDKVLSPIQTPADSQPPPLDKVLSPIQTPADSQPPPLDRVLPSIQTPADSQPPPLDKVLSSIQTPADSQPAPLDKVLSPIQTPADSQPPPLIPDTDSQPLLKEQSLPSIQTPTDSQPTPFDKEKSPISKTDSLSLLEKQLPKTPTDSVPLSISHLESTNSPPLLVDETLSPIPVFESSADNKPYLKDNLATPLSETVTLRTKDTHNNNLPQNVKNLPLKMNLEFPDIYEVYNDELPLSMDDLPIKVNQENSESSLSMVDLPIDVAETPELLSKTPASDLLKSTDVLSLPLQKVLEIASPDRPFVSATSLMSDSMDNEHRDFPSSTVPSDGLPALPIDEFKSPIHKVIPNSQIHDIATEIEPQKHHSLLSVGKEIRDISSSDDLSKKSFVIDETPSTVTDKILNTPNSTEDTKDQSLVDNCLLSPEDDANLDSLVTDIPTKVSPSLNEALQFTNLDKTSDEVLSESSLSGLPLPDDKTLPLPDNKLANLLSSDKTLSTSKLPITKALLENVLSDITKGVLSSHVAEVLPVTPPSQIKEISLLPAENSFPNAENNEKLIDNLQVSQISKDTPTADLSFEFPLPFDETNNDKLEIPIDDAEGKNNIETQTSNYFYDDQSLSKDKISPLTDLPKNEKTSSSKLPITKALLENVLSEINTKGFSVPISKAVPASFSVLDKTHYYLDSPLSDLPDSPPHSEDKILSNTVLTDNNLQFSGQSEDILSLEKDKRLLEVQSKDMSTEILSPLEKTVANSNNDLTSSIADILPLPKDTPSDPQSPKNNNKLLSLSKLPIAKALLENVLLDINGKGFSLPVAKGLPVASRSQLDKTLYFLESSRPDRIAKSSLSDIPTENDRHLEINEDVQPADKVVPDNPIMNIPTDELMSRKMYESNSDVLTEEVEDFDETLFSEELTDDISEMEKQLSLDDILGDLGVPQTKQLYSSRLPITKALLVKVLSDITDGAIAA